jgi:ABC-type Fe3+/spermidine/putrescine transport system ATPase subunit
MSGTSSPSPVVEATALRRVYGNAARPAVDGVSISVGEGEVLALVGPSGCGKSTTLRMIAGLEPLDGGTVRLDGTDASRTRPEHRRMGWVPQSYGLFPHMSVAANVEYGLRARRVPAAERRQAVAEALRLTQVSELAGRSPAQLSGGQRQRVALARALATDPRVLLLDEPLAALDPQLRDELRVELARILRSSGRATILVTHDQSEALALADRIAILRDGRLVQCATPSEIWRHPADAFVANFVARGTVVPGELDGDGNVVLCGLWRVPLADTDLVAEPAGAREVQAVVRPRDVAVTGEDDPHGAAIDVRQCEYLGDCVRVVGELGGTPVTVELPAGSSVSSRVFVRGRPGAITVRPVGDRP